MEKTKESPKVANRSPKTATIFYHGACQDGLFSAVLIQMFSFVTKDSSTSHLKGFLDNCFESIESAETPKNVKFIPDTAIQEVASPEYTGECKNLDFEGFETGYRFIPYYHSNPSEKFDFCRNLTREERKFCVMNDISRIETAFELAEIFEEVYMVDHHKTAVSSIKAFKDANKAIPSNLRVIISPRYSATLIFYYLFHQFSSKFANFFDFEFGVQLHRLVDLANQKDTMSKRVVCQDTKDLSMAIIHLKIVEKFNSAGDHLEPVIQGFFARSLKDYIEIGAPILKARAEMISKLAEEKAKKVKFFYSKRGSDKSTKKEDMSSFECFFCVIESSLVSPMANHLVNVSIKHGLSPVGAVATEVHSGENGQSEGGSFFRLSFRGEFLGSEDPLSIKNVDLEEVAFSYGGGGHRAAAGAKVDRLEQILEYLEE